MNNKTYRILGKKGRITIPGTIRTACGFACNDIVSFEEKDGKVTLKREKICDGCLQTTLKIDNPTKNEADFVENSNLLRLLDNLTPKEQQAVFLHLSVKMLNRGVDV